MFREMESDVLSCGDVFSSQRLATISKATVRRFDGWASADAKPGFCRGTPHVRASGVFVVRRMAQSDRSSLSEKEGAIAPLREINIAHPPESVVLASPVVFTPTFVVVDNNKEVGRITGYPGPEFF